MNHYKFYLSSRKYIRTHLRRLQIIQFLLIFALSDLVLASNPQIGFAHRVNDWNEIQPALSAGANGIEIDICWGGGLFYPDDWYVSHNDANVCRNASAESLTKWTGRLRENLNGNSTYKNQLVALWIDVKDLADDHSKLYKAVNIIHSANLPGDLKVIYDLTGYDSNSVKGFKEIKPMLKNNEGISMCAGKSCGGNLGTVKEIYDLYKSHQFTRGGFNSGDSVGIDQAYLTEANKAEFNNPTDPYRFKFIHTWTNRYKGTMKNYVDPSHSYQTSGQIIGEWGTQYEGYMSYIIRNFKEAVNEFSSTQHMARKSDPIFNPTTNTLVSALNTSKCLDVSGNTGDNGTPVILWDCHGHPNQKWTFNNNQVLSHVGSNKCLDPRGPSYAEGTVIQIWDCVQNYKPQMWILNSNGSISPMHAPDMCVDVQWSNPSNGTKIQLWKCSGTNAQKFFY